MRPVKNARYSLKNFLILAGYLGMAGCASNVPVEIADPPESTVSVAEVRAEPGLHVGSQVRWGGAIAAVTNLENETLVEIVARDLESSGSPREADYSPGRFIARIPEFIDPTVYAVQRELTVFGTLEQSRERKIGEFAYTYPVVKASSYLLWEPRLEPHPYPGYYDPFYYPRWHRPYRYW